MMKITLGYYDHTNVIILCYSSVAPTLYKLANPQTSIAYKKGTLFDIESPFFQTKVLLQQQLLS